MPFAQPGETLQQIRSFPSGPATAVTPRCKPGTQREKTMTLTTAKRRRGAASVIALATALLAACGGGGGDGSGGGPIVAGNGGNAARNGGATQGEAFYAEPVRVSETLQFT